MERLPSTFFFFNDTATTEIYTLSLHDALPISLEHDHTRAPERQFACSIRLRVRGPDLFAQDVESDLYAAMDLVVKKIEQQLRKRRNKSKARKHKVTARTKRTRQVASL